MYGKIRTWYRYQLPSTYLVLVGGYLDISIETNIETWNTDCVLMLRDLIVICRFLPFASLCFARFLNLLLLPTLSHLPKSSSAVLVSAPASGAEFAFWCVPGDASPALPWLYGFSRLRTALPKKKNHFPCDLNSCGENFLRLSAKLTCKKKRNICVRRIQENHDDRSKRTDNRSSLQSVPILLIVVSPGLNN